MAEQPLDDLLGRLERERLHADRMYNDALTRVDAAIQTAPHLPDQPRRYDEERLGELNDGWKILGGAPPTDRTIKGRLRAFIWRLVGPPLQAQERFNAALVDHLNRNVAAHHAIQQATAMLLDTARREFDALASFESLLVQYLQTVTPYLDTRVRRAGGDELRDRLALAEQRILAVKRDLDRQAAGDRDALPPHDRGAAPATAPAATAGDPAPFGSRVDSLTYVGFEDRFRGSADTIRARLDGYVPIFAGASDVVDVGCGRGELLGLFQQHGIRARGVDTNDAMVELCRARGFDVERDDALHFLERQADASLGGLIAIQVVEHFDPAYLLRFLETAHHKLRPGSPLVLETINAACWMAFFETYLRDVTHRQALHPDTLRYLVETSGFANVDVRFREPVRDSDRLEDVSRAQTASLVAQRPELGTLVAAINGHADKLNARLFSSMDYAVVARR